MKKRTIRELFNCKKENFTYTRKKVKIKSNTKLTRKEILEIYKIAKKAIKNQYYGCEFQTARKIVHKIAEIARAEVYCGRNNIIIQIYKKYSKAS